jgi:hypothetical protein
MSRIQNFAKIALRVKSPMEILKSWQVWLIVYHSIPFLEFSLTYAGFQNLMLKAFVQPGPGILCRLLGYGTAVFQFCDLVQRTALFSHLLRQATGT